MIQTAEKISHCGICGGTKLEPQASFPLVHLVRCRKCDFHFSERRPSAEELNKLYSSYLRVDAISPITIKRYHEILDGLEVFRQTNNLIDVGCGNGYFLQTAKKRGWNVFGVEATKEAVTKCEEKGIQMHLGELETGSFPGVTFDVVASFEVLEHMSDPKSEVEKFFSILRAGGAVYATTPNFNSLSRHLLKSRWNVVTYPEHLSYFSRRSIKRLFASFGFVSAHLQTTGISLTRLRSGQVNSNQGEHKDWDEKIRVQSEGRVLFRLLKRFANFVLDLTNKGDALKATFIKVTH